MSELFKEVMVWKRLNTASAVRYCCLNDLQSGKYAVQSADFFYLPLNEQAITGFARQFAELLIEVSPHERCSWFETLADAIADHDQNFS